MSLKLSRNKVNFMTRLVVNHIETHDEADYTGELGDLRFKIYHLIMDELKLYNQIEEDAKEKIKSQKKSVPEESREWEILFRKYSNEALDKLGKIWT